VSKVALARTAPGTWQVGSARKTFVYLNPTAYLPYKVVRPPHTAYAVGSRNS
jgi:hypothetical protein